MIDPVRCKCGGKPEMYTGKHIATQKYIGVVECQDCGKYVYSVQRHWDEDSAAKDAVEEWNKKMGEDHD